MREDVIFEAIEFLRKRYSLAERVYFHHAKMAASAMIIKAVDSAGLKCEDVWSFGDHSLLLYLQSLKGDGKGDHVASTIANLLLRRELFKLAYELRHRIEYAPGETVDEAKENYAKGPNCRENQRALEDTLTQALGIGPESLAVYSPDPKMNLKAFEALVWPKGSKDLMPLKDLGDARPESEELIRKHQRLWRLAVFIRRDLYYRSGFLERVQRLCRALIEGQRIDVDTLAESYAESHKEDFSGGGVSWNNRDRVVAIVRQAIVAKERGGFSFPEVKAVLTELRNQKQ
jgi:HD superfamily phosphohydrolase